MVITGDLDQCDLPKKYAYNRAVPANGLADLLERIRKTGEPPATIDCYTFSSDDVQRETVVKDILKIYAETDSTT